MHESITIEKLTRNAKKANRKLNKLMAQASKKMDIEVSSSPTRFIMIGNAGLMTGLTTDDILMTFISHGPIDDIIMVPCQSFCFVTFANVDDAVRSMQDVHGRKLTNNDKILYLSFVSKVPSLLGFAATNCLPPGLILVENAITEEQEELLLKVQLDSSGNSMKNRIVKHYGYEFLYDTNNVDIEHPMCEQIPISCQEILTSFLDHQYISQRPDQLTINQYQPGQGIPMHVDTHSAFEDEILSISLGSPLVMEFKHPSGQQHGVLLPRRSLLIMTKESRYLWSHGIAPRKTDIVQNKDKEGCSEILYRDTRISYTFRKVLRGPCQCQFPQKCDSQEEHSSVPSNCGLDKHLETDVDAKKLENAHVHQVYDEIALHFSNTRHTPWPRVTNFIESLPVGTMLLDLGCGNGKYLGISPMVFKVGCDRSNKLMAICGQRGFNGFCCDATILPLRSESFDACLCIAVIHHLATMERRLQVVHEIARILKPGSKALIYVWALEQKLDQKPSHYIKSSNKKQSDSHIGEQRTVECLVDGTVLPIHVNRTQFAHQDLFVPWHLKSASKIPTETSSNSASKVLHRYYHVFQKGELEELCTKVGELSLKESYYDNGNWCVIVEKNSEAILKPIYLPNN